MKHYLIENNEIHDLENYVSINPRLEDSKFDGLRAYSKGFVKEGVGAGGSMIASILKTGIDSKKLLKLVDKEYLRVTTSR